jgi:large subunit ribosomal protein L24e
MPIRYNRELIATTLQTIKRVQEIRQARERRFYQERMKIAKKVKIQDALREIQQNLELVAAPALQEKLRVNKDTATALKEKNRVSMEIDE